MWFTVGLIAINVIEWYFFKDLLPQFWDEALDFMDSTETFLLEDHTNMVDDYQKYPSSANYHTLMSIVKQSLGLSFKSMVVMIVLVALCLAPLLLAGMGCWVVALAKLAPDIFLKWLVILTCLSSCTSFLLQHQINWLPKLAAQREYFLQTKAAVLHNLHTRK